LGPKRVFDEEKLLLLGLKIIGKKPFFEKLKKNLLLCILLVSVFFIILAEVFSLECFSSLVEYL